MEEAHIVFNFDEEDEIVGVYTDKELADEKLLTLRKKEFDDAVNGAKGRIAEGTSSARDRDLVGWTMEKYESAYYQVYALKSYPLNITVNVPYREEDDDF